jgi:hypothetical protein
MFSITDNIMATGITVGTVRAARRIGPVADTRLHRAAIAGMAHARVIGSRAVA